MNKIFGGDIFEIQNEFIPLIFDFLLGGFTCQPFSAGGKHKVFRYQRYFVFEIERILRDKNLMDFILENVEGLIKHDLENKKHQIGRTLKPF